MLFRPAESSKQIVDFYRNYLLTTFQTTDDRYNSQLEAELKKDGIISNGPFISVSDSYEKEKTIAELVENHVLCESMLNLGRLDPYARRLYRHQVEAILKAEEKKNLIITTGTGSGKTECFLIPVVNELLKQQEAGTLGAGVRALIIYPMNALVNDQIRRLRELFSSYEGCSITYGKFTGETAEDYNHARNEFVEREGIEPPKNELICREQMRKTPPNILITNYAMLEYLLLRPGDVAFFSESNADKWQTIILDEAHTYGGAKGIEVGTLLKRVKAMLKRDDIQFILTSATLGDNKSNQQIVNFAQSLCSTRFEESSIIRSHTKVPEKPAKVEKLDFAIYKELSERIRDNIAASNILEWLRSKGITISDDADDNKSLEKTLFNMILSDSFYYEFRALMLNQTKPLNQIACELNLDINDLTDFIAVASNAQVSGDKLFEARYHMFLRGIEGVYVTLNPDRHLFVTKMEAYKENPFSDDCGYKVFAISFCHNCNATFIVGQTEKDYLVQKSKFNDNYEPEVYLLEGDYDESEIDDAEADNIYVVCAKCGAIKHATSLDGLSCGHDSQYHNLLRKVKEKGDVLHSCPCCHIINTQRSIVRPYFLGNEAATAVIATGLYNVLPDSQITKKRVVMEDDFFGETEEMEIEERKELVKQFLTFSDNRQAAAFFASYLEVTYRSNLIKRVMTKICEDHIEQFNKGVSLDHFVSLLEEKMEQLKIGTSETRHKVAWIYTIKELINYKSKNSLQNKGILYFDIKINMPDNTKLGMSASEVTALFKLMALYFVKKAAIDLPITVTKSESTEIFYNGISYGFVKDHTKRKYIESWLPAAGKDNIRTLLIKRIKPDLSDEMVIKLLESIWSKLNTIGALSFDSTNNRYLLSTNAITVRTVKKLYKCNECKMVTPFYLNSVCSNPKCNGHLTEHKYEEALQHDHYQNIYRHLNMTDMIAREHTAQLGSQKAYAYQNEFKNEHINVLSCSTTFEMGVDVGSLETVFMRNMPPSPANYAQRAGRAGRSIKSAAYALTYCPNSSHDLNYFKDPVAMIKGTIIPPTFNVDNEKIVLRHIFASAFSFFWKKYPELFKKNIGEFFDLNGMVELKSYLQSRPVDLKEYLQSIVSRELQVFYGVDTFAWVDRLFSEDANTPGIFVLAYKKYCADIEELEKARRDCIKDQRGVTPGSREEKELTFRIYNIGTSLNTIKEQRLIEFLSRNNLIPKYGFPVDTVELTSLGKGGDLKDLRLDRDLFSAISEYAPDSEVVADGKLITSRYVRVLNGYSWPKYNYATCSACQTLNRTIWTEKLPQFCRQCGHELPKGTHQYIIPKFGFVVDNAEPIDVGTDKPERTYKGSISYIGDGKRIESHTYSVCNKKVLVGTSKMDELAVLNTSDFFICNTCGYGKVFDDSNDLSKKEKHKTPDGYNCSCDTLTRYAIGHEFQTDVVLLKFVSENLVDPNEAWTILYSLLEGLSKCLHIDRTELSGCLHWYRNEVMGNMGNFGFVLFDNTPGGAGYVRQLRNVSTFMSMLEASLAVVSKCTCGGDEGDTACYGCLCNYYNQKQHDVLQRRYAIAFLNSVKNGHDFFFGIQLQDEDVTTPTEDVLTQNAYFNNDGQDQSMMSYDEIWNYLSQDTEDEDQLELIQTIASRMGEGSYDKPHYSASITTVQDETKIIADLVWPASKVLLFLRENAESFKVAKSTNWTSFCLNDGFNIPAFIQKIKR